MFLNFFQTPRLLLWSLTSQTLAWTPATPAKATTCSRTFRSIRHCSTCSFRLSSIMAARVSRVSKDAASHLILPVDVSPVLTYHLFFSSQLPLVLLMYPPPVLPLQRPPRPPNRPPHRLLHQPPPCLHPPLGTTASRMTMAAQCVCLHILACGSAWSKEMYVNRKQNYNLKSWCTDRLL